jgi:cold shock CspA family protein
MVPPTDLWTRSEPIVKRGERKVARIHRGTLAVTAEPDGYGFIEPAAGGGQLLVRQGSIEAGGLRVGDVVQYAVSAGSFAVEAVSVRRGRDGARRL